MLKDVYFFCIAQDPRSHIKLFICIFFMIVPQQDNFSFDHFQEPYQLYKKLLETLFLLETQWDVGLPQGL